MISTAARISSRRINSSVVSAVSRRKNVDAASFHNAAKLQTKAVPKAPPTQAKPKSTTAEQSLMSKDPHQLASERVRKAPDSRIPGTEALESITPEQKMKNYATALGLVTFCTGVWYYSIKSVGKAEGGIDELRAEAQEARDVMDRKSAENKNAEELAQLDVTMSEMGDDADGVIVDVAAQGEGESNTVGGAGRKKAGRPLWKKIVFFWKRE
mmetsp:Transcript_11128/g.16234  ORF Transcript_11128/g.16234 Transcript_11128/m.16234 type:complete len:212 (-) Transcript_11128:129-764(-)